LLWAQVVSFPAAEAEVKVLLFLPQLLPETAGRQGQGAELLLVMAAATEAMAAQFLAQLVAVQMPV
jgi:hypothetical protein